MKSAGILILLLLFGIVSAGTVSITGSCRDFLQQGNVLNFTLINTGNDTAYNLVLTPKIYGAVPTNSSYSINSLPPNLNVVTDVKLLNITHNGSYVDAFSLSYEQGSGSTFSAIFPCMIETGQEGQSLVNISASTKVNGDNVVINVALHNSADQTLGVNVVALLPQSFTLSSDSNTTVSIPANSNVTVSFDASTPAGESSYTGAISATYLSDGTEYSSFALLRVSTGSATTASGISGIPTLYYVIGLVIAIILVLIVRSILVARKSSF